MTELPKIKNLLWQLIMEYFKKYFPYYNTDFSPSIQKLIDTIKTHPKISGYQWMCHPDDGDYCLLRIFLQNFLGQMQAFYLQNNVEYEIKKEIDSNFLERPKFRKQFDNRFKLLEEKILLSDTFEYTLIIPIFQVYFPEDEDILNLDKDHILWKFGDNKNPYGKSPEICDFIKPPLSWAETLKNRPDIENANVSLEISIREKKRSVSESSYSIPPYYPFPINWSRNQYAEHVRSIYDFFNIFEKSEFSPIGFSNKFYLKLPPFSQMYKYASFHPKEDFPIPSYFLDLRDEETKKKWLNLWNDHYSQFYNNYYTQRPETSDFHILRYGLEVLRIKKTIPYLPLKNFMIISTLESLFYTDKLRKNLKEPLKKIKKNDTSKKTTVAKTFSAFARNQKMDWRFLFRKSIKPDINRPFDWDEHMKNLESFIIDAYNYRNNIAHPATKPCKIDYKPGNIYNDPHGKPNNALLAEYIMKYFPKFIKFSIYTWIQLGFTRVDEWHNFLLTQNFY